VCENLRIVALEDGVRKKCGKGMDFLSGSKGEG
jgi:hypothetical protein